MADVISSSAALAKFKKSAKYTHFREQVKKWASYYRARPDKLAEAWGIKLAPFQRYLLCEMMRNCYFAFFASRALGKTFLTALFAIIKCILYPGSKVVIATCVKSQGIKFITEKLPELIDMAPAIKVEIAEVITNLNTEQDNILFHNGSRIKVVASSDNARSGRATVLILDEFRMIDPKIYQSVLRRLLGPSRRPKFMNLPEYKSYPLERNQEIFLSSPYFKSNWSYDKFKIYLAKMVEGSKYRVYAFPYQMAIKERIVNPAQLMDELSESDKDPMIWSMEMECLFYGQAESAFFDFEQLNSVRVSVPPVYPMQFYDVLKDKRFKFPTKKDDEIRVLCVDIASIGGKNNDASAYFLLQLLPDKKGYIRRFSYGETLTGGHSVTQALSIRRLFNDLDCDYVVMDRQGNGIGVYDQLAYTLYDKERGCEYSPWVSMNETAVLQSHCLFDDAEPLIYTISANDAFNDEIARSLRDLIIRKRVQFLGNKTEMNDYFSNYPELRTLTKETQVAFEVPFAETDALMNEMILLERDINFSGGKDLVRLRTVGRNRKDRYTAVAYGNYFANVLEKKLISPDERSAMSDFFLQLNGGSHVQSYDLVKRYFL